MHWYRRAKQFPHCRLGSRTWQSWSRNPAFSDSRLRPPELKGRQLCLKEWKMYHRSEEWKAPAPPPATYQGAMLPISSSLIKVSISASCKRLFTICASRGEEEYTSMSSSSFRSLVMVGFVLSLDLR